MDSYDPLEGELPPDFGDTAGYDSQGDPEYYELLEDEITTDSREVPSLIWLARTARLDPEKLAAMLLRIRRGEEVYEEKAVPKADGGKRTIQIPIPELLKIQRAINQRVLSTFWPAKCAFGFSGGNIVDAVRPHLKAKVILSVDLRNAFQSVSSDSIVNYLISGKVEIYGGGAGRQIQAYGRLSWYCAKMIVRLCTRREWLIQGAPTSPRLFDLVCGHLDKQLLRLAKNTKGVYTRYADNIIFSYDWTGRFPGKVKRAILRIIEKGSLYYYPHFSWHGLKIRRTSSPVRLLGLNLINGQIHNTRNFKRRLRLSLHHIGWLLDQGVVCTEEWQQLQGQMAFCQRDTLPNGYVEKYLELEKRSADLLG